MSDAFELTPSEAEQLANGFDCVAIAGDPFTIQLDLDLATYPDALNHYTELLPFLQNILPCVESDRWVSKSGKGLHVVLKSTIPLSLRDRLVIQAALGSDPRREILAVMRIREAEQKVSYLFKPRTPKERV